MQTLWRDVRYALRSLVRAPGFAAATILALAVGIGANTANFSLFDAIVWQALPVRDFGRLVLVSEYWTKGGRLVGVSAPDFADWQGRVHSLSGMAAYRPREFSRTDGGMAQQVDAAAVTPNFFALLGAQPLIGRSFFAEEAQPAHSHVALLSYNYWQSQFAGARGAVGRTLELDHAAYTIVGVMPRGIEYPTVDIWVPLALAPAEQSDRARRGLQVLARLAPGVSLRQAQAELTTVAAGLAASYPGANKDVSAYIRSFRVFINGNLTYAWAGMFLVAMLALLLIACANVANLQLARGSSRQREIAIRAALGASRRALIRQLLTESLIASLLGGLAGLAVGEIGVRLLGAGIPPAVARLVSGWDRIRIDTRVLAFTMLIAVLAGVVSGVLPAFHRSRVALVDSLKEGGRGAGSGRSRHWLHGALVVAQMALALVLLVVTAMMARGFRAMAGRQEQFAASNVLVLHVSLPASRYGQPAARLAFYQQALARLSAIPGAQAAATFTTFPLSNNGVAWHDFQVAGRPDQQAGSLPGAVVQITSPGFLSLLRIPLVAGRDFSATDGADTLPVTIVSGRLARRFWPAGGALGRQIRLVRAGAPGPWLTIVGVAGDVLWDWTDQTPELTLFQPYTQAPAAESLLAVRDGGHPESLAGVVRAQMATVDPDLPLAGGVDRQMETLSQAIRESIVGLNFIAGLMAALGIIAFCLATVGVYSVMAYSVIERTHEIGVRMALGASAGSVVRLMLRRGAQLLAVGLVIGFPLSYALARLLGGLLYGVRSNDSVAFAGAIAMLGFASLAASYIPARQAAQADPVDTLRAE
ncbi:MAG TPA: ABC transporter permease [Candidatus Acidoferrales bacterium]|nr:ABC transporter permease [Candidatus Acidoferrales bacterium]